jgi:hypothetical protein
MRALTLWRPWSALILLDHPLAKRTENRSWSTTYRGEFLVHSSKRWDPSAREMAAQVGLPDDIISWEPADHPTGIVGRAALADVCDSELGASSDAAYRWCACDDWAVDGQYHWGLAPEVQELPVPVECPGKQGWWAPPWQVDDAVERQLAGVAW